MGYLLSVKLKQKVYLEYIDVTRKEKGAKSVLKIFF